MILCLSGIDMAYGALMTAAPLKLHQDKNGAPVFLLGQKTLTTSQFFNIL